MGQKLLHLQYADDILLFLKADPLMVESIKWTLRAFEGILGLKINFSKSELVPINLQDSQMKYYAQILNCKVGSLPIKYLGLSLH